jgi:hypothetical protein
MGSAAIGPHSAFWRVLSPSARVHVASPVVFFGVILVVRSFRSKSA